MCFYFGKNAFSALRSLRVSKELRRGNGAMRFSVRSFGYALFYYTERRMEMKKIISLVLALVMCLSLCACGKSQAVKDVEEVIKAIGEVSLDSEEAILKAERMYDYLTDSEKSKVENKGVLVEARYAYDKLYTDTIYNTAKEAYDLMNEAYAIYLFNAHGLNNAMNFGESANAWTMDSDFCKRYAEASNGVLDLPKLTEQEVRDALEYLYNDNGLSGNVKADKFFCMTLFNRACVFIRGYRALDIMEDAGVLLLKLKDTYHDEKYYPILKEYFDFVATGNDFNTDPNNFVPRIAEYQTTESQYKQEINPMFVD